MLNAPSVIEAIQSITNKSGQAFYNIGKQRLLNVIIPLPPLEEQKRIVARIEELMPRIDKLR